MSDIQKALKAARDIVDACAGDNRPAIEWASEVRAKIDATLSSAAVTEREPVAFLIERLAGAGYGSPRSIVDASKYDPRRDEFWHGDAKSRHLVTPLYPPASELEALRKVNIGLHDEVQFMREKAISNARERNAAEARLAEALKALDEVKGYFAAAYAEGLADRIAGASGYATGSLIDLVRRLLLPAFEAARRVREGGKVDG